MDHLFHFFIPGTPENTTLLSLIPALAPLQLQIQLWAQTLKIRGQIFQVFHSSE